MSHVVGVAWNELPICHPKHFWFVWASSGEEQLGREQDETGGVKHLPMAPARRRKELQLPAARIPRGLHRVEQQTTGQMTRLTRCDKFHQQCPCLVEPYDAIAGERLAIRDCKGQ